MNILVTGANGQLGNEIRIISKSMDANFIFTDVIETEGNPAIMLNIVDIDAVRKVVNENNVDCIVNCAAYTNVDAAETNEVWAEKLNAIAPENLAIAMKEINGLLIHISTDYVFGGDPYNIPYKEDQKGAPTGVYGKTKLQGEQNISATSCKQVIIRTEWLYSEFGKNFVKTMLNLTAAKPQLKVVFDQVGTPTYAYDLAVAIATVIDDYKKSSSWSKSGIYHFSNEDVCSWFDFTIMIAEYSGHTTSDIQPCHLDEFFSPVRRPAFSVLDKTKIKATFGGKVPYWTQSVKRCISNLVD